MKGNSDKMFMSFQLPPLEFDSKPYEELVFQQNKLIIYTNQPNKKSFSKISTPKTYNYHSRPNTTATFNTRFNHTNQLSRNRNQQSIDRFIQTHQKINSIRYQPVNQLKKIKAYKTSNKNFQSLTENKFFPKGKLENSQVSKHQILDFQQLKSNDFIQQISPFGSSPAIGPEQRLITQIKMSRHNKDSPQKERNNNKLMSSIKSLGKLQTERSLDQEMMNTVVPLVMQNQKSPLEIKARNHFPLRKSHSMTQMQTSKFFRNSKPMSKDPQNKQQQLRKQQLIQQQTQKQPEIKQQNSPRVKGDNSENVFESKQNRCDDKKKPDSIDELLDPQYLLRMTFQTHSRDYYSAEDTQLKPQLLKNKQALKYVGKQQMRPLIVEEKLPIKENGLINQNIPRLDFKPSTLTQNNQQLFQNEKWSQIINPNNKSPSTIEKKSINKSPFLKTKSSKSNKQVLSRSNLNPIHQFMANDQTILKRAPIIDYLNQKYYKSLIDRYQKIVSQQKNAFLGKSQSENYQQSKNFAYSKNFTRSDTSQLPVESNVRRQVKELVYLDNQFTHQDLQIPQNMSPVTWLYFAPSPNSSLFPKVLKLPQHYVQTSMKKPLPLIRLLNCLLTVNPKIIQRLFEPVYNNVFSVWLNINGTFKPIFVDGYLPYDSKLNSLYGHSEEFLWVAVLIKAAAKSFGGYQDLQRLSFDQWCRVILGFSLETLAKPQYEQIKQWGEQGFEQKIQQYFKRGQIDHQSYIIIHKQQTHSLSIIKSINNNKIRFTDCEESIRKHEISLFELLIDKSYVLFLVPQSKQFYHRSGEFAGYWQGNIVSYQLRVYENESWLNIKMGLRDYFVNGEQHSGRNTVLLRRRLLIYEIPVNFQKPSNKKEMTLIHALDNFAQLKSQSKIQKYTLLEASLPQLKKGQYKIFIECGNIQQPNLYLESNLQSINKRVQSEGSYFFEDYITRSESQNKNPQSIKNNEAYGNFITFTSNNRIQTTGSQYINTVPNEPTLDKGSQYFSPKVNQASTSFYY